MVFDAVRAGSDDGEPVIALHGFPQTSSEWAQVMPALAAHGMNVVAPDQRGYSPGARPTETAAYQTPLLAADIVSLIAALGWDSAHIVGHDWGAIIGWWVAATRPDLVRTLTAVSVPHPRAFGSALVNDPAQRQKSGYVGFFRNDPQKARDVLLRDGGATLRTMYQGAVAPSQEDDYLEFFGRDDGAALVAGMRWYGAMSEQEMIGLAPVTVPTTFLWGDEDIAIGTTAAHACAEFVTGDFDFQVLESRGHWLPDEDPQAVVDAVIRRVG
jgi:pimeloyl-ACP methyl ester carboxylesterase